MFYCCLWFKVSSLFYFWPQPAGLFSVVGCGQEVCCVEPEPIANRNVNRSTCTPVHHCSRLKSHTAEAQQSLTLKDFKRVFIDSLKFTMNMILFALIADRLWSMWSVCFSLIFPLSDESISFHITAALAWGLPFCDYCASAPLQYHHKIMRFIRNADDTAGLSVCLCVHVLWGYLMQTMKSSTQEYGVGLIHENALITP